MDLKLVEVSWLDARESISLSELSRVSALSPSELDELVDYGALVPLDAAQPERCFSAGYVMPLRTAGNLRRDFDLDLFTVGILLGYLHRIHALEGQLRSLEARVPAP